MFVKVQINGNLFYKAVCDKCGSELLLKDKVLKRAAKSILTNNWFYVKWWNPDNTDNNPCMDYKILCPDCLNKKENVYGYKYKS